MSRPCLISALRRLSVAVLAVGLFVLAPTSKAPAQPAKQNLPADMGLKSTDMVKGAGAEAGWHSKVKVHYTGWLMDGTKFDSSRDRDQPFELVIGMGQVIPGWEMGLRGMKVGGKRELVIPAALAYGAEGAGGVIPPNATLRFEIELLDVTAPAYTNLDEDALEALLADGVTLVDIRRPDEQAASGLIANSKRLAAFDAEGRFIQTFPDDFETLVQKDEPVIVIDQDGRRSALIAYALTEQAGYKKVFNATDGIASWIAAGKSVVPGKP